MDSRPTRIPPSGNNTRGPYRSATGPNKGDNMPPPKDPKVIAAAVTLRLQPRSSLIGFNTTAIVTLLTPDAINPATMAMTTMIQP